MALCTAVQQDALYLIFLWEKGESTLGDSRRDALIGKRYPLSVEENHSLEIEPISPKELKEKALLNRGLRILDVRELEEWDICRIPGGIFRPLSSANTWLEEEAGNATLTIVYCHHGVRSAQVCLALSQLGHRDVRNLTGGIAAWQRDVDRAMPTY